MLLGRQVPAAVAPALSVVSAVLVGAGAALLAWCRLDRSTRGTAWAEDAGRFLAERLAIGPVQTLWHPYDGYQHLVPRVLTDLAVALRPIGDYAHAVSAMSCLVVGVVAACVVVLARDAVPSWPLRVLLGVVPAVVPLGPYEVLGNLANLHWFLLFLAPWLFAARIRSWWASGWWALVALAVTGTEIQAVVFLPLFLLGVRDRRTVPVAATALLGVAAQVVSTLAHPRPAVPHPVGSPADVVLGYLLQPVGGTGTARLADIATRIAAHGWALVAIPLLVVLAVVVGSGIGAPRRSWLMLVAMGGGSVAVWIAAVVLNLGPRLTYAEFDATDLVVIGGAPLRYAAASSMFLIATVVVAAGLLVGRRLRTLRVLGWALVVLVVTVALTNGPITTSRRSAGPAWEPQVRAAEPGCRTDPAGVAVLRAAPVPTQWAVRVPCALVLGR